MLVNPGSHTGMPESCFISRCLYCASVTITASLCVIFQIASAVVTFVSSCVCWFLRAGCTFCHSDHLLLLSIASNPLMIAWDHRSINWDCCTMVCNSTVSIIYMFNNAPHKTWNNLKNTKLKMVWMNWGWWAKNGYSEVKCSAKIP